jgi:hypothetical protein
LVVYLIVPSTGEAEQVGLIGEGKYASAEQVGGFGGVMS